MKKTLLISALFFASFFASAQIGESYTKFSIDASYFGFSGDTVKFQINQPNQIVYIEFVNSVCSYFKIEFASKKVANRWLKSNNVDEIQYCNRIFKANNKYYYVMALNYRLCMK